MALFFYRWPKALLITFVFLHFIGCTPPVYQNTTYDIEEFMRDSNEVSGGKFAILQMENQEDISRCPADWEADEEVLIDGDELSIALYYPKRQDRVDALQTINDTTGFRVCNGSVHLPHIGSVEVDGLPLEGAQKKIQMAYREQLPQGQVFVNYQKRQARYVQIIGAEKPIVLLEGKMRLSEVLAKAKIPSDANLFKSYVMRNGQQLPIDLYKLIHKGDDSQNIRMQGDDQIFIARGSDATIIVTGEVLEPVVIPAPYGFLTLREALVKAGGIPFTGDKGCIQVIRGDFKRPKIYCLDWNQLKYVSNDTLLLIPGDIVVISERPITQWNRFINQVQPSASGMQAAYNIYTIFRR